MLSQMRICLHEMYKLLAEQGAKTFDFLIFYNQDEKKLLKINKMNI